MTPEEKTYVKKWFEVADHDIENARMIIEINPTILDIACFHCQQAVEKYLKAFLVYKKIEFEKIHDVVVLQKQCQDVEKEFAEFALKPLNDYAVRNRYPDDYIMPSLKQTKEYYKIAFEVKQLVLKKIKL
jgi:HEPN domain-containing protein